MARGALWLALLLVASAAPGQPPARLTYEELRTLPDEALARRLFGVLAPDIVLGLRPDWPRRPFLLRGVTIWVWTRPRASLDAGICLTDRTILSFEPDLVRNVGRARENPVLRLARMETRHYYIVHDRALAERRTRRDPEHRLAWAEGCAARDPTRDGVPADSGWQLMHAYALVAELGAAARAGRAHVPLDCSRIHWNGDPPADDAACLAELRYLGNHSVTWVSACRGIPAAADCIRVLGDPIFIEFSLNQAQQPIAIRIDAVEDNSAVE